MSKVNSSHLDSTSFWSDREEVPETSDVHLSNMMMLRWKMLRVEDPHIPIPSDSRIERYLLMYPQIFRNVVESSRRVFSSTRVPVLERWCSSKCEWERRDNVHISKSNICTYAKSTSWQNLCLSGGKERYSPSASLLNPCGGSNRNFATSCGVESLESNPNSDAYLCSSAKREISSRDI